MCAFRLASLREAFAGPYRQFDAHTHLWSPLPAKSSYFGQVSLLPISEMTALFVIMPR